MMNQVNNIRHLKMKVRQAPLPTLSQPSPIKGEERHDSKRLTQFFIIPILTMMLTLLGSSLAQETFEDVSESTGITAKHAGSWEENYLNKKFDSGYLAMGQAWGDYNNDGWQDLFVTGGQRESTLYKNNSDGTFSVSEFSSQVALPDTWTGGAVWADYDNDGWTDLYVLVHGANVLFKNNEGKGFEDVTAFAGVGDPGKSTTATWGDYDEDGFLDLYVANWSCFPECKNLDSELASDHLYHNNGDGSFTDVTTSLANSLNRDVLRGSGFSASFVDFDNDGDLDIYVVNDRAKNPVGNVLWRNDGRHCPVWCWSNISKQSGANTFKYSMGLAVGDYDNDLDLDFYVPDMVNPSSLLQNQDGVFADVAKDAKVDLGTSSRLGWGTAFFDADNDGWLDLYLATTEMIEKVAGYSEGMMFPHQNFFFRNNADGTFSDNTPQSWIDEPAPTLGVAYADYDRDGFVDFVQGNWSEGYKLYRNQGVTDADYGWLRLELHGAGRVNRDAIGSRAYLHLSDGRTLMQEVKSGSSLGAGNETALHFGLGTAAVDKLEIIWSDGTTEVLENVRSNQILSLTYKPQTPPFSNVSEAAGITAKHKGSWDMFSKDFKTGYLGIGQAWGDYDNDGWVDLYVTGNMEPSTLYHNNGDGTFNVSEFSNSVSLADRLTGGAVWADYDNDGYKDLYVLAYGENTLFHNEDGQGFKNVTVIAGVGDTGKGFTATWGDYDEDSFLDLYVVNWACTPECGDPPDLERSQDRLYHNNGDGTFTDVSDLLEHEKLLGSGFTASFTDFDGDGDMDIYVVNDELINPIGNVLFRNDGAGCDGWCWSDASKETGAGVIIAGMGLAVADYDNDQDLDMYFSNMVNAHALLQNTSEQNNVASFSNVARDAGVEVGPSPAVGWGSIFFDYDNDGWQDLALATTEFVQYSLSRPPDGMLFPHKNLLYQNARDGTFRDVTPHHWIDKPEPSMGIAYADYDQDGWLDFVVGNFNEGYALHHNDAVAGKGNNWLNVRLVGGGIINRDAIGTRVYLTDSTGQTQMQQVITGGSLGAGNDTALHFGLGNSAVSELRVVWPDGTEVKLTGIEANQHLTLTYRE